MESPDRVTLYSVNWTLDADSPGPHLDAILDGSVSTRRAAAAPIVS